jgi:hypothetical protein
MFNLSKKMRTMGCRKCKPEAQSSAKPRCCPFKLLYSRSQDKISGEAAQRSSWHTASANLSKAKTQRSVNCATWPQPTASSDFQSFARKFSDLKTVYISGFFFLFLENINFMSIN